MDKLVRALALAVCLLAFGSVAMPALAERPVEDFTAKEIMEWARISPDGSKLVAEMEVEGERKLVIMPLDGQGGMVPIGLGKGDLNGVSWVGNDWLVASVGIDGYFEGHETYINRAVAFRSDGTGMKVIEPPKGLAGNGGRILWRAHDGTPRILLQYRETLYLDQPGFYPQVAMVDISKNRFSRVVGEMPGIWNWYADTIGAVRMGVGTEQGGRKTRLVYREGGSGLFDEVANVEGDDWLPVPELFLLDNKALTISRHEGFGGVYELNLRNMKIGAKVFSIDGYDVDWVLGDPVKENGLLGISWVAKDREVLWFDSRFLAAQQLLDGAFKDQHPQIASSSDDAMRHIVEVDAGDKAGFYLLDIAKGRLSPIVRSDDTGWSPVSAHHYEARDGLEIEAFITWPRDRERKGLPVIIMPHGGPRARDRQDWDIWAQFFADRGYMVVQPNFRGSLGYGKEFEDAGLGEWGLKMQDDVDDALAWVASEGWADSERACVIGASYGGYVAMRAAQRNPELYRCAISFAGVADLKDMMDQDSQSYFSGRYLRDYWRDRVDDLKAVSPINHPDEFGIPILLIHGKDDLRVPVEQSRKMYDLLKKAGKQVEYIEQPEGDHHFTRDEDMHQFLLESEKFLDKYNPS